MIISRNAAVFFLVAAGLMPAGAQAQWYSTASTQPPLYPYAAPSNQPYAVQVSPNTYVIQRPGETRQRPTRRNHNATSSVNVRDVPRSKVDPALVEELRGRPKVSRPVVEMTQVVRDKPVVVETKRYVDDPPRVVERYVDTEGRPIRAKNKRVATVEVDEPIIDKRKTNGNEKRVINAEAEITIIGPDRMSIRLFRKGDGPKAKAE
jgi:hypothetical protein